MIHVTPASVPAAARYLPAVPEGFELSDAERLSDGLRRLSLEEFDRAIGGLLGGSDVDVAIHEARKSMKRLRAVLRLIRDELGEDRYRQENDLLRNTARLIAPVRDSAVRLETVSTIRSRFSTHLKRSAFERLEHNLRIRHLDARTRVGEDPETLRRVVRVLHPVQLRRTDLLRSHRTALIHLEFTSRCNLRCTFCAVSQPTYHGRDLDAGCLEKPIRRRRGAPTRFRIRSKPCGAGWSGPTVGARRR